MLIHSSENDVLVEEQFFGDAKLANQKQAQVGSSYKGTMWSVMTLLIILLCVVSVLLLWCGDISSKNLRYQSAAVVFERLHNQTSSSSVQA